MSTNSRGVSGVSGDGTGCSGDDGELVAVGGASGGRTATGDTTGSGGIDCACCCCMMVNASINNCWSSVLAVVSIAPSIIDGIW